MNLKAVENLMQALAENSVVGSLVQEHLKTGGKRLRARLALQACEAFAIEPHVAFAAACELAHNATLVHDDIEDGDILRRGQPTLWKQHGIAKAINAGDLLFMLPYLALNQSVETSPEILWQLTQCIASHLAFIIEGQGLEFELREHLNTDKKDYLTAIRFKTSGLFELPVQGAALLAGFNLSEAKDFAAPFGDLGVVFQLQDDLIDMFGNKGRNLQGSDIYEGKISALVIEHLLLHPHDRSWLLTILSTPREQTTAEQVLEVKKRFSEHGALKQTIQELHMFKNQALQKCQHPKLKIILTELLELILAPIQHLL